MGNYNGDDENNGTMTVILTNEEIKNLSRDDEEKCLLIEERKVSQCDCPCFILLVKEEDKIAKPSKSVVTFKLFGRNIGDKALDTRLK